MTGIILNGYNNTMTVDGDTWLRANTNGPKTLQILHKDGVTPLDLTAATDIHLVFQDQADNALTTFKLSDVGSKITLPDAVNGKVTFAPAIDDFTSEAVYSIYVLVIDAAATQSVPEKKEYTFTVRA
jgi:hypothetical protein